MFNQLPLNNSEPELKFLYIVPFDRTYFCVTNFLIV